MRKIKFLVVHCSDSPDDIDITAEEIHSWHLARGWSGIGYNAVITRDGEIQPGRPDYWQGAHVRDFNGDGQGDNSDSLGVCLIGRDAFTGHQYRALEAWLYERKIRHPLAEIVGHCDLDPRKTCPNFDVRAWWEGIDDLRKPESIEPN